MPDLPRLNRKRRICVICEGNEDYSYFTRLKNLGVWNKEYEFYPLNAKSASNIPARFQDAFQNDRYEIVLVFCDTDKEPYREYKLIKRKINDFFGKRLAAEKIIIFANPCTMQIILSHFGDVSLKNQGKKSNALVIKRYTGIDHYDAHEDQIASICGKIGRSSYKEMKKRVEKINFPDTTSCSTNLYPFLLFFESDRTEWIESIGKYLRQ